MPIPRKDVLSGAIIFDLTPDEIEVKNLKDEVTELKKIVSDLKSNSKFTNQRGGNE